MIRDCPICGKKAMVDHVILHGEYDMGWSICCPSYRMNDGVHDRKMSAFGFNTKDAAIKCWNEKMAR